MMTSDHQPYVKTQQDMALTEAVAQTRDRHVRAVNAGDAEAAAKMFAPNGVFLPPGLPALQGSSIRGWFDQVFANFLVQGFTLTPDPVEEHCEIAIEQGNWKATFVARDGSSTLPAGGTYLTIYARLADGSVRMIRDTFNGMPGRG